MVIIFKVTCTFTKGAAAARCQKCIKVSINQHIDSQVMVEQHHCFKQLYARNVIEYGFFRSIGIEMQIE